MFLKISIPPVVSRIDSRCVHFTVNNVMNNGKHVTKRTYFVSALAHGLEVELGGGSPAGAAQSKYGLTKEKMTHHSSLHGSAQASGAGKSLFIKAPLG